MVVIRRRSGLVEHTAGVVGYWCFGLFNHMFRFRRRSDNLNTWKS